MTNEFIDLTHHIDGEARDEINVNRSGALNIALIRRLTEESNAETWDDAKHEWRVTGNVWYIPLRSQPYRLPQVHLDKHPQECICGHPIAWHFEVENTQNGNLEILGSEHITNWMIIRHLKEVKGIPADAITEEKIMEWIKESVKTMKAEWWWNEYGDDWKEFFDEVKELDLRINVRSKGNYFDHQTKRYEKHWTIAKTKVGSLGKMASVVWRWNHPDNPRRQIETRGFPNEQLWKDVQLLYARMEKFNAELDEKDAERNARIETVEAEKTKQQEQQEARRKELMEKANQIREETGAEYDDDALTEACIYYDIPPFTIDMGKNSWENKFLNDMRNRIVNRKHLSEKQLNALLNIIDPNSSNEIAATDKQVKYIKRLGGEPNEGITKTEASEMINELLRSRD